MKIALPTENPTKVAAAHAAAQEIFKDDYEIVTYKTESGISDQPLGNDEIYQGAKNRAEAVLIMDPSAEISIGMEGGIVEIAGRQIDIGIVYVLGRNGVIGMGVSPGHVVPPHLAEAILADGKELSEVVDEHYAPTPSKTETAQASSLTAT